MGHHYTSSRNMFSLVSLLTLLVFVQSDIYLHNLRGSNNRLNERTRQRRTANRMFDSQNNQRGGYNVGEDSMYFYAGSVVSIEWTNQHSCAVENSHCELILQYMCGDSLRDGTTTRRIPSLPNQCKNKNCNTDTQFGMHEDYDYYMNCLYRERNKGLFTVNKIKKQSATGTRQNPNGNRNGYECPEERDYYPYWNPTPWVDIAVMTNDVKRCEMYQQESQNVKGKFSCVPTPGYIEDKVKTHGRGRLLPTSKEECEKMDHPSGSKNFFTWKETKAHGVPPPWCGLGPQNRDNHLGNGIGGFPNMYNWTVPDTPHEHCAFRIRYNISTEDYDAWKTNITTKINIGKLVGIDSEAEAKTRDFQLRNNPKVQILKKTIGNVDLGAKLKLQLAINTNQYGRTFQDRSHSFAIRKPPTNMKNGKIHNINVRGKRGNIVQVYPAVEYDYVPNRLLAGVGDHVHFQWTGSNTNPGNNDGQGRRGTDRNNVALLRPQNYPEGKPKAKSSTPFGHWGNNYPAHLDNVTFLGFTRDDLEKLMVLKPNKPGLSLSELDDAGAYFDLGGRTITHGGTYYYMCTRNNNFSNRSQKGKIVVVEVKFAEESIGWSGGEVVLNEGKQGVWIDKGATRASRLIHVEEWSEKEGSQLIESKGGYMKVGENYQSNFLAVYPFENIVDKEPATIKLKVSDEDIDVYHSVDYQHWRRIDNIQVQGSIASFKSSQGGVFVARKSAEGQTYVVAVFVVLLVAIVIAVGTVCYCRRKSGDGRGNPKRVMADIRNNFRDAI